MMLANPQALLLCLAILVCITIGLSLASTLLPERVSWLSLALAPGIGSGVCSLAFFLFRRPMFTVEAALTAAAAFLLWKYRTRFSNLRIRNSRGGLLVVFLPLLTLTLVAFTVRIYRVPHGGWDGWAIWNWEARLLYRAGAHWKDQLPFAFHGDYPLLVPITTARLWRYTGTEIPEAGAWLGGVLGLCSAAVLILTLGELRGVVLGMLLGVTLLGTPSYLHYATSEYADIPLSFYFLGSLALTAIYFEKNTEAGAIGYLRLAGFLAGCAAWTKNEGVLFLLALGVSLTVPILHKRLQTVRRVLAFATGAALPLLVLFAFKLTNTVRNYVVAYEPGKLQKALDLTRHATILKYIGKYSLSFGAWYLSPLIPLFAFVLLLGIDRSITRRQSWLTLAITLVIVSAGYYVVYLTTPVELKVHLDASLDRLFLQLWPSFLLLLGLLTRTGQRQEPHRFRAADPNERQDVAFPRVMQEAQEAQKF